MADSDPHCTKPVPMRLVSLSQLHQQEAGVKVRFIGYVHEYQVETGALFLQERFPCTSARPSTVAVLIDNIRETVGHESLQVGAWLNVVGYVGRPRRAHGMPDKSATKRSRTVLMPVIESTMVWSAGAIKLDKYYAAARKYQETFIPPD